MARTFLSVVIPAHDEAPSIAPLHAKLKKVLKGHRHELIFIDDGSRDGTRQALEKLSDSSLVILSNPRRMGKSYSLSRGFAAAKGDIILTLDADLQDDPAEIPKFLAALESADLVVGWKVVRKDPFTKVIASRFANALTNAVTGTRLHDMNCGFKAMRRSVIETIRLYGDLHRYIPALAHWEGFRVAEVPIEHHPRKFGRSKYGISRLFAGLLDLVTVKFLMTFGSRPLHFFGPIGIACTLLGTALGGLLTWEWLQGVSIGNRPLLMLAVLLVVLGVQFISLGLLGEMVTRIRNN